MAELNLIPNPLVLCVQAGIFGVNYVVVKKLFVEPYLKVKDRRDKMTTGSKDDAIRLVGEAEAISQKVSARLQGAYEAAKGEREKSRQAALAKRDNALAAADKEAKAQVAAVEKQIQSDLVQEKAKVPAVVAQLTDEVYRIALA